MDLSELNVNHQKEISNKTSCQQTNTEFEASSTFVFLIGSLFVLVFFSIMTNRMFKHCDFVTISNWLHMNGDNNSFKYRLTKPSTISIDIRLHPVSYLLEEITIILQPITSKSAFFLNMYAEEKKGSGRDCLLF